MIRSVISVIFTEIKFFLMKLFFGKRFAYSGIQRFSPNTELTIEKGASISLGKMVRAHSGTRIRVRKNASVCIGNDVAFGYRCMITAHEKIEISDGCEIGPGVLFYDHDHDFHSGSIKRGLHNTSPIVIGKNVWIGANAIILRGAVIGDECVVAAGTIVRAGEYAQHSLIYDKRETITKTLAGSDQ